MPSTCFTAPPSYPAMQALQKNALADVVEDAGTGGPRSPRSSHSVVPVYSQNLPADPALQMHCDGSAGSRVPLLEQSLGVVVVVSVVVVSVVDVVNVHLPFTGK